MRRILGVLAGITLVAGVTAAAPTAATASGGTARPATSASRQAAIGHAVKAMQAEHESYCQRYAALCTEPLDSIGVNGEYTGHDEPSVLFQSKKPGTGYDMTYNLQLPTNPPVRPRQNGSGGTWDFQLRPTFWLGMTLCDSESAPEYTHTCTPDSDYNARFTSSDPASPFYIGKHPGNAYMELQFYSPGYVPQFEGFGCTATQWCANLTIDSYSVDQNTGIANNADCLNNHFLVGVEPINWAYVTRNGKSQAPANPLYLSDDPTFTGLNPDPTKDLMMNSGDQLRVHLHDTPAGFRVDIGDRTTGQQGSMTASIANGFGQIVFDPNATTCSVRPYAFHPMYNTGGTRGNTWSAHTYNVAFSDEIGHFELCGATDPATFNCTKPAGRDQTLDEDDTFCPPAADSTLIHIVGCLATDADFDGMSYQRRWPGTLRNAAQDQRLHERPVTFTSPTSRGREYENVAFETDLPRIEDTGDPNNTTDCDRHTGANCINPPPGAQFYPLYTTTTNGPGACAWQQGGPYIPGTTNTFGGTSTTEYGGLLATVYPIAGFTTSTRFNNFNRSLGFNPCRSE